MAFGAGDHNGQQEACWHACCKHMGSKDAALARQLCGSHTPVPQRLFKPQPAAISGAAMCGAAHRRGSSGLHGHGKGVGGPARAACRQKGGGEPVGGSGRRRWEAPLPPPLSSGQKAPRRPSRACASVPSSPAQGSRPRTRENAAIECWSVFPSSAVLPFWLLSGSPTDAETRSADTRRQGAHRRP